MPTKNPFRSAREAKGMTQAELARRVGVSPALICLLEYGKRTNPTWQTLAAIAHELDVTPSFLIRPNKDRDRKTDTAA